LYVYADNDPINFIDLSGADPESTSAEVVISTKKARDLKDFLENRRAKTIEKEISKRDPKPTGKFENWTLKVLNKVVPPKGIDIDYVISGKRKGTTICTFGTEF
jgi:hypothetical protein